jgi:hypothetical protein
MAKLARRIKIFCTLHFPGIVSYVFGQLPKQLLHASVSPAAHAEQTPQQKVEHVTRGQAFVAVAFVCAFPGIIRKLHTVSAASTASAIEISFISKDTMPKYLYFFYFITFN